MTPSKKYTLATLAFYALLAILIVVLDHVSPSGPCTPGMGVLLLLFLPVIAGALFVFSVVGRLMGRKVFLGPTLINGGVLVVSLMLFHWRS